jgi:tagatose 1,6-diphosphate aldolase
VECLEFAGHARSGFHGVLCGRSVWSDGIPVLARHGEVGLCEWLGHEGLCRLRRLEQRRNPRGSDTNREDPGWRLHADLGHPNV